MAAKAKTLTYVDSNVLIYAINHRNKDVRYRALMLLGDKRREFLASEFLRLETLPYAIRSRNQSEIAFFERFFDHTVKYWVEDERDLFEPASKLIQRFDFKWLTLYIWLPPSCIRLNSPPANERPSHYTELIQKCYGLLIAEFPAFHMGNTRGSDSRSRERRA